MCSFVLGDSPLKLMFLGRPKRSDSSWLLEKAISVHDEDLLLLSLALPTVSLLSIGLLADGYGAVVVTLQNKHKDMMNISLRPQIQDMVR